MAQDLHHEAQGQALRDQERRCCVPEIVQSHIWQVRGRERGLEFRLNVMRVNRAPARRREKQSAQGIIPVGAGC
jgi:hypothetical protein